MTSDEISSAVAALMKAAGNAQPYQAEFEHFVAVTNSLPIGEIVNCEHLIRASMYPSGDDTGRLPSKRRGQAPAPIIPWLDLFSGNGYRREKALWLTSSAAPNAFLLAILLRQLNHWVPEVREAARSAVKTVVEATDTEKVVDAIWATYSVAGSWGRLSDEDEATLSGFMQTPRIASGWIRKLCSAPEGPISKIMNRAFQSSGLDRYLPEIAEVATRPAIRARAFRMMLEGRATWPDGWTWRWINKPLGERTRERTYADRPLEVEFDFTTTLTRALADRTVPVRRVAGDALIANWTRFPERAEDWAQTLASSKNASLSSRGEFVLRKLNEPRENVRR